MIAYKTVNLWYIVFFIVTLLKLHSQSDILSLLTLSWVAFPIDLCC